MSLLDDLLRNPDGFALSEQPVITLLYDRLPVGYDWLNRLGVLNQIEALKESPEASVAQNWSAEKPLLANVTFDNLHAVEIAGLAGALPEAVQQRCIWSGGWRIDLKELMASHRGHIVLRYTGQAGDPIEQYLALYKLASVFPPSGLLGVVLEPAWASHPGELVFNLVEPEMLNVVRDSPPFLYWSGFIALEAESYTFLVSRGHHLFGLPDFAWVHQEAQDPQEVQHVFHDLLTYFLDQQIAPEAGHVVAVNEDHAYEFFAVEDSLSILRGAGETLIVHPLSAEEQLELGSRLDDQYGTYGTPN